MDDFVLWAEDRSDLRAGRDRIGEFLDRELCLELKPEPYINRCRVGMDFLGCRVYPSHITLSRRSRIRFQRRLMAGARARGAASHDEDFNAARRPCLPSHGLGQRRVGAGVTACYDRHGWAAKASHRVNRGGSWNNNARNCRPANRNRNEPDEPEQQPRVPGGRSSAGAVDSAPDWTGRSPVPLPD